MDKVPEPSLIEAHDLMRIIVVGIACAVVSEQRHVPVAVVLKMQVVQVVGGEIDLGLWVSP